MQLNEPWQIILVCVVVSFLVSFLVSMLMVIVNGSNWSREDCEDENENGLP